MEKTRKTKSALATTTLLFGMCYMENQKIVVGKGNRLCFNIHTPVLMSDLKDELLKSFIYDI